MQTSGEFINPYTPEPGDSGSVFIDNGVPLPETYGDNCLVIMARDPSTIFVYWDVQPERFEPLRAEWGHKLDQAVTVLRVFDVTDHPQNHGVQSPFFDVDVPQDLRQYYVKLPQAGRRHYIVFGLRLPDGTFIALLRSNTVVVPNGRISDDVDAQWVSIRSQADYEAWEKVLHNVDIGRGSADFSRQMAQRWHFLKSVFSMGAAPSSMPNSLPGSKIDHE